MSKPSSNSPEHQQLMDPGALRSHIQAFTADLTALGHTRLTVSNYSDCARHFADWLNQSEVALSDVDAGVVEQFVSHRCHCPGNRHHDHLSARYVSRVRRFVRFLAARGACRPWLDQAVPTMPHWRLSALPRYLPTADASG